MIGTLGLEPLSLATLLATQTDSSALTDVTNERDYTVLKRRIQDAGLLDKKPAYYALSITTNLVLWTFCLLVLFTVGSLWAQAIAAVVLGIISGQLGFQLHDSGHRQMFNAPSKNALVGLVTTLVPVVLSLVARSQVTPTAKLAAPAPVPPPA